MDISQRRADAKPRFDGNAMAQYERLHDQVVRIERKMESLIQQAYPPGSRITFERGGYEYPGIVMMVSAWGTRARLKVRNERTGREYWICHSKIVRIVCQAPERSAGS